MMSQFDTELFENKYHLTSLFAIAR